MAFGVVGMDGTHVVEHVVEEVKAGPELVIVHHLRITDQTAMA